MSPVNVWRDPSVARDSIAPCIDRPAESGAALGRDPPRRGGPPTRLAFCLTGRLAIGAAAIAAGSVSDRLAGQTLHHLVHFGAVRVIVVAVGFSDVPVALVETVRLQFGNVM